MSDQSAEGSVGRLHAAANEGCAESRMLLSRRGMLGLTAGLFSSAMLPRSAVASGCGSSDPRMLLVILRGGMDGLAALAPYGDDFYERRRDKLAYQQTSMLRRISSPGASNYWGLHPSFKTVEALYKTGNVAFVHGVAPPWRNRSHFDCQENLETGFPGIGYSRDGWLNRFLADGGNCVSPIAADKRAIQIGRTPLVMRGSAPTMGWTPSSFPQPSDETRELIREMYRRHGDKRLAVTLDAGLLGQKKAIGLEQNSSDNIGESLLVFSFRGAGNLLGADDGPRIATLNYDGWDTHTDEFPKDSQLSTSSGIGLLFAQLDEGVAAFKKAVGSKWKDTVVLVVTEFGRMVVNNGNLGSDHGAGSVAMLIGGAVKGGQVAGNWAGLEKLYEDRDLLPVNDLRSVFKGVMSEHFDASQGSLAAMFPDSRGAPPLQGLIRS